MRAGPEEAALLQALLSVAWQAPDADALLRGAADLLAGELADVVVVDRLVDPDLVVRVAVRGRGGVLPHLPAPRRDHDGEPGDDGEQPQPQRSSAGTGGLLPRALAAPGQVLHLDRTQLTALADSDDPVVRAQAAFGRSVGATDVVVLGLGRRERPRGALTLLSRSGPLDPARRALARDAARLLGLALETLGLREVQRDLSQAMQTSLLPPLPAVPGLVLAARYQPAVRGLDVGGDWYDAFPVASGDLALVIGDAAGHDTFAAARMAQLRHALRVLAADRQVGPAEVLTRLDRALETLDVRGGATCVHARLGAPDPAGVRRLSWSSAGHLPPVLVSGGRAVLLARDPDLMLGVDADTERLEHAVDVGPGDVLLLCTDGLVEDRGADLDERLELLRSTVEGASGAHPESLADLLVATLAPHSEDDVALLVVRVLGGGEPGPGGHPAG